MMNLELIDRIETELDPAGVIRADVARGDTTLSNIDAQAAGLVSAFDGVFADDGGAGVTADEMADYLRHVMQDATGDLYLVLCETDHGTRYWLTHRDPEQMEQSGMHALAWLGPMGYPTEAEAATAIADGEGIDLDAPATWPVGGCDHA